MSIDRLLTIMTRLRDKQNGCPWDQQQSFQSLIPFTLEEAYEVADTIEQGDWQHLPDELGDLLFQVVFYAEIAREQQLFDFNDITNAISEKLIRRHPHVFANEKIASIKEQSQAWENHKRQERQQSGQSDHMQQSELDGISKQLPALVRAQKLQRRAAHNGFDWEEIESVFNKLNEEIRELQSAMQNNDASEIQDELGDVIFTCVNLARFLEVDAEQALRLANNKFENRFQKLERHVKQQNKRLSDLSLSDMDSIWEQVKADEKNHQ
jgi:MazG family protein